MTHCCIAGNANGCPNVIISFSAAHSGRPSSAKRLGKQFRIQSCDRRYSYGSLAVRLFGPPTRFEASKLKVVFVGDDMEKQALSSAARAYTLTHCDFTANLTLEISNNINHSKVREWQMALWKDDVVVEWKIIKDEFSLHVHCFVSGANILQELAADIRYHIFSKELPLVLQAVVHGDSALFVHQPELMDSMVWVHFHSKSKKYNRTECWGPLKDAIQRTLVDGSDDIRKKICNSIVKWTCPEVFFHAFVTILL
ncbi:protein STAY-GREEN LIKE, chloroplastic-like isoform X2 [Phalaenopsis equestris]|uniref:protein STAY-GREEN LIKE, chloroplastic-like isoform X2 n=1 Tax=Phalaenopsis equestris TaxID=78828 RepID=UPI0009E26A92|nr:protein STAY-GREEN LIKE, chloroplastic-like isoform X2 [Phalaenopsis equestris]